MRHSHLFGPVCSRRLGRSLGVDLVPFKTCTYDCVYCECGNTTAKTTMRREFFPKEEVIEDLDNFLSGRPVLDYITLSGSGEPTLSLSIGDIIQYIKRHFPDYRVAVLTNGSLLWQQDVREALFPADVVLPTLSTTNQRTFQRIHRPDQSLHIETVIRGLQEFRQEYQGEIWLEVFIIPGINTTDEEIAGLRQAIGEICPDRIQLNTLDRPGAEDWVLPATPEELERIRTALNLPGTGAIEPPMPDKVISESSGDPLSRICGLISRRPCTLDEIAGITGLHRNEVSKLLRLLITQEKCTAKREERGIFYYCRNNGGP